MSKINKLLVANRGEIAIRIFRAATELDIETVAIYSNEDLGALHRYKADESYLVDEDLGPTESYLDIEAIIKVAKKAEVDAIHPGYGFLSENKTFAKRCAEEGIKFIGPDPSVIDAMGNKSNARAMMIQADVPVIPGSDGVVEDIEQAYETAERLGYPVMVKASAGGGGKGIRIVYKKEELQKAYESAKAETKAAFGDDTMYMEKVIENARHVEVQVLGDNFGNVIHLGERDCSLQRKNQKVLEEAPSPAISAKVMEQMCAAAVRAAKAAGYQSAGTIEFLYDKSGKFYFMEMNTRVQVEHPVTEMVTGVDIIKEQVRIADGQKLSMKQEDIIIQGHAIECRINAENPDRNFAHCPGLIDYLLLPAGGLGIRVDTAVYEGYEIPPFYDSMIAKVIVHGKDRKEAIAKMKRALYEFIISGIETNIEFQNGILHNEEYLAGEFDTSFLEKKLIEWKE